MPHLSTVRIIAAGILATSLASAYAETAISPNDLSKNKRTFEYINSQAMANAMFRMGLEQDKKFGIHQECKTQIRIKPYSVSIIQPIDFPDDKQHPIGGIWNVRYQLQRCEESKLYNAIFVASGRRWRR